MSTDNPTPQAKLTRDDVLWVLKRISLGTSLYNDWEFLLHDKGDGWLMQLRYTEPDVEVPDGPPIEQKSRKWYVSQYSTLTEIVRTAHKMVMCSLEHRLGEHFQYQNQRPYNPHFDIESLGHLDDEMCVDRRKPIIR